MKNIAVIGCGAAGMMAAIAAAENGGNVTLLEKNERPGKKLYITGKGRCNITNNTDTVDFFDHVCKGNKFLYSSIYSFDKDMVINFFEKRTCPVKVERGDRVFPVSDKSSDVIKALTEELGKLKVDIRYNTIVTDLIFDDIGEGQNNKTDEGQKKSTDKYIKQVKGVVLSDGEKLFFDRVIIATGGLSYPSTGSTGDGYKFAREIGHNITKLYPSLVPFNIEEGICEELMGLSLKNVRLSMYEIKETGKDILVFSDVGEMLFTHFGVSGPLVLRASALYNDEGNSYLEIDLKPGLDEKKLDDRLVREFDNANKRAFKNSLSELYPNKLIPIMIELSGIDPMKRCNEIKSEERKKLLEITKALRLNIISKRGYNEAVITRGGIKLNEINPHTMESKLCKGLYFAGEVMDVDAFTGGFNLQIAWSTGHLSGVSATED